MSEEHKDFSVSKVMPYSSRFSVNMKNSMAVLKFNTNWDNFFSQCEGAIKDIMRIESAIEKRTIDLTKVSERDRKKFRLDPEKVYRLKQIWNGGCFITRKRHPQAHNRFIPDSELFHYDSSKINFNDPLIQVIPLPALDNMTPIGKIRDQTLLIQISEAIPLYLAFEGMDFDTLIREAGFYFKVKGKMVAKFTPEDLNSKVKKTYKVGRNYYYKTIKILKQKFLENWTPLEIDIHNLIVFAEIQEENLEEAMMIGIGNSDLESAQLDDEEAERDYDFEDDEA